MNPMNPPHTISTAADLEALFGPVAEASHTPLEPVGQATRRNPGKGSLRRRGSCCHHQPGVGRRDVRPGAPRAAALDSLLGEEESKMSFDLPETLDILDRTPTVVGALLRGTSASWHDINEGPDTWSAFDVVGHLIHGEETDWTASGDMGRSRPQPHLPGRSRHGQAVHAGGRRLARVSLDPEPLGFRARR
jgi:hypothetical protein